MKNTIEIFIRILVGVLFVFSGLMKSFDSQSFAILIGNYGAVWAGIGAPIISGIEVILGLCMILNIKLKFTAFVVSILTIIFTIAFAYAFFFKGIKDCGCMGSFNFLKIPPFVSFTRNILIIAGCFWIWKYSKDENQNTSNWKKWVVYIIGGLSLCLSSYTLGTKVINRNDIHVGDQINVNDLRLFDDMISEGTSLVFIFSSDCDHCWNATENVKSIRNIPEFSNVIGIALYGDTAEYMKKMKPNFPVYIYPSNDLNEVINEVPVLLILENGKIKKIFTSKDIPCGQMLKKIYVK